eukprot:gene8881-biopygen15204
MPAPRPRHTSQTMAYSPRHARAMPAPRPRHCPVTPGGTGHARATPAPYPRHARATPRGGVSYLCQFVFFVPGRVLTPAQAQACSAKVHAQANLPEKKEQGRGAVSVAMIKTDRDAAPQAQLEKKSEGALHRWLRRNTSGRGPVNSWCCKKCANVHCQLAVL